MNEVCRAFKEGHSHMGMVCDSAESAKILRDFSDKVLSEVIQNEKYEANNDEIDEVRDVNVLGLITLENVIERILQMDIKDEKDLDKKLMHGVTASQKNGGHLITTS
jgi:hypothetical protein